MKITKLELKSLVKEVIEESKSWTDLDHREQDVADAKISIKNKKKTIKDAEKDLVKAEKALVKAQAKLVAEKKKGDPTNK